MRTKNLFVVAAATLALTPFAVANFALAQETTTSPPPTDAAASAAPAPTAVPAPAAVTSPVTVPSRGSSMDAVKSKFGAPTQEESSVGTPPITRWDYPGYSVFFENDKVLHTVIART